MITIQRIVGAALRDPATLAILRKPLSSTLAVSNPHYRALVEFAGSFYDRYKATPQNGDWEFWLTSVQEPQKTGLEIALHEVINFSEEKWTPQFIGEEVTNTLRAVATQSAVARLGTLVPNVPVDALKELQSELDQIQPVTISGLKDLTDVNRWIYSGSFEDDIICPTGFRGLDNLIGGFRKELVFVLADSGVGKTSLLVNFGTTAALHGARVLHITMELSDDNTLRRYYRRIAEAQQGELREEPAAVATRVGHWIRLAKGSVHVLYQQPYILGADELEGIVDQFCQMYGGMDMLILDYMDLMKSPPAKSEYEGLGKLSHMCRNIGLQRGATTLSATQASRGAHRVRHLRLDMMGDSYRKVQAADIILGYLQTEEEEEANQGRLCALKVRENPGRGTEIPVYVNLDVMRIADLDGADMMRLAQQFGHPYNAVFRDE